MKILLDTNIILDILLAREPFVHASSEVFIRAEECVYDAYLTSNSIADIVYLLRKQIPESLKRQEIIKDLLRILDVVSVTKMDIIKALDLQFTDFEDALQTQCAKKSKIDYIVTRNTKDFTDKDIKALTPEEFLKIRLN